MMKGLATLVAVAMVFGPREGDAFAPAARFARAAAPRVDRAGGAMMMGLFDGLKDAFGADGSSSSLPADRETPIDRWLGVDVSNKNDEVLAAAAAEGGAAAAAEFIDSMDEANYVALELAKPMGVVFEENEPATGGVFIASFAEGGAAEADGTLQKGDQLVVVADTQVIGRDFDFCLDAIRASDTPKTR
jgi:hypothetical protein